MNWCDRIQILYSNTSVVLVNKCGRTFLTDYLVKYSVLIPVSSHLDSSEVLLGKESEES